MKKLISYILLLAMCVSLFAACNTEPATDAALESAKEYLYSMYKDAKSTTDADYEVVSQVRIDGVVYPITWSADKAENVQFAVGEKMTTVKITAADKDVNYKLTATLKNDKGQEVSVSFDRIIPAKAQLGGTIVLAYPKENKFITGSHYLYTGKNKWQLELTENEAEAVALQVIENDDGTVTFTAEGKYLFCDATHVKFADTQDDNTKFVLEAADTDGGFFIKCAVANYGGKAQYLEVYSGYLTCYGMGSDPSIYVFKLQETTTAAGTISGLEGSADPTDPTDPQPSVDSSNDPAADSALSISDAIALGASKAHDTYTAGKYYVTGEITEVYNEQYGNMKIKDANGNILTIYGTYDANGTNRYDAMSVKPVAGDTVTIYGIIGQYNGTPQIKNGWITAHTPGAGGSTPPATEPAAPADGKVVISFPKENKYITGAQYAYTSSSGKTKIELTLSENKADAIALEKITNSDGTVSFKAGSKYLFCDATDVKFADAQSDNTKFVLEATNGGYFIKCAVANYQGKAQYLEVYSGYLTVYSKYDDSDASIYTFKLDNATGANGTITAPEGGNSGNSGNTGNTGNTGNSGETGTITGKLAASLDMMGTTNLVSRTTTQTVYKANNITYTNDKASSQTDNYDQKGTYAARAYQSSTIKIEYTGMVAIVFTLDDFTDGKYLTGFDGMEVAGATISRNGDKVTITFASATNVFQSAELLKQVRIETIEVYTAN